MQRRSPLLLAAICAAFALPQLAAVDIARARVQADVTYSFEQLWQASVRLVRVDLRCSITERDETIGFLMFEYRERAGAAAHAASIELVRTTDAAGTPRVRVVVQVQSMPSYIERMILSRLERKLRDDFGEPPRVRAPRREEPPVDGAPAEDPPSDEEPAEPTE